MARISAVIITYNEEEKIGRCIDALLKVADEIVVVDSYSTDNTRKICEGRGVRFIEHAFEGHIEQKNFALSQTTHDFVLSLDADEYLSEQLTKSILAIKDNPAHQAYSMARLSSIRGRWIRATDWYPDRKTRLWFKQYGRWGGYNPHDHVIVGRGTSVRKLEGEILHEAYDSYDQLFKKAYTYATIYAHSNVGIRSSNAMLISFKAWFAFVRNYIFKRGVFYGFDGLAISISISTYTFTKYSILRELNADIGKRVPTTLIITTYNRPDALQLVLHSALQLSVMPEEIIIADDGSTHETKDLVDLFASRFSIPIRHCWHEDSGFRLATIRNKAIAMAKNPYIVMIDGDMVMPADFIADHKRAARPGRVVQGSRVLLGENFTRAAIHQNDTHFSFFSGDVTNRKNIIRSGILSRLFSYFNKNILRVRGANMAFWKTDVLAINGFNENFVGWGREDSEFIARLQHAGVRKFHLKFAGAAFHLYHPESRRDTLSVNDQILKDTVEKKVIKCDNGINKYLKVV
ncbi:glycosyltransferase [Chryseolinea sp. T2]|uniref:glycosyltransferase family 2 protein n=1 Tax=Chryseolinea sp. T2 TaxID=3129255 RepID=UPI003077D1BF